MSTYNSAARSAEGLRREIDSMRRLIANALRQELIHEEVAMQLGVNLGHMMRHIGEVEEEMVAMARDNLAELTHPGQLVRRAGSKPDWSM
jgi:hypothetical protein